MDIIRPTFIGIGAHKAGTSWLFRELSKHPDIWIPYKKELHYFDRSPDYSSPNNLATSSPFSRLLGLKPWQLPTMLANQWDMLKFIARGDFHNVAWCMKWTFGYYNDDWYENLFSQAGTYKACGEITPSYAILKHEDLIKIKAMNADIKIIFLIRDPIERAWSAIRFHADRGFINKNIVDSDDDIIAELKNPEMLLRGDYESTIDAYLQHFDSSQILVCFYDAISCDPVGLLSDITKFLEVPSFEESVIDNKTRVNMSPPREMSATVRDHLDTTYAPMIDRIGQSFGSYATMWGKTKKSVNINLHNHHSDTQLFPTFHP